MLERRGSASKKKGSGRNNKELSRPIGTDEFIDNLTRCYHRLQKNDDDDFCIVSLTILDYKRASENLGAQVASQIDKTATRVLFGGLRAEDRVCLIAPAQYIVLMPATTYSEASAAMRRIVSSIGEKAIRSRSSALHPSGSFRIACSSCAIDDTAGDAIQGSPDHLLATVGYTIDPQGQLVSIADAKLEPVDLIFRESFDDWRSRYRMVGGESIQTRFDNVEIITRRMRDLWSNALSSDRNSNCETVCLRVLRAPDAALTEAAAFALVRRLRALQNQEHPGLSRLFDFYIDRDATVYTVNHEPEVELKPAGSLKTPESLETIGAFDLSACLLQILSALDAAQSMIPPVVPKSFKNLGLHFCPESGKTVLSNYDIEYLSNAISGAEERRQDSNLLAELSDFFVELSSVDRQQKKFLQFLKSMKSKDESNASIARLRSKLKALMT